MPKTWRCPCGKRNTPDRDVCAECEASRPEPNERSPSAPARRCPIDGTDLRADGLCAFGQGYPITMACPIACPFCRHALTWEGRCFSCHGCTSGQREDWTIPGDRYELVQGHWQLREKGPQRCSTVAENRAALRVVEAVYQRRKTEAEGRRALEGLFGHLR